MKKSIFFIFGILAMVLALGLVFASCDTGNGGNGGDGGNGGNISTIIIKNRSGASITVELTDDGASGYEILSGLGEKTIDNNAEGTWSLECSAKNGGYVGIIINGHIEWIAHDARVGRTHELTWDGSDLTQPPQ
jgi:hypothetical protein